MMPKKKCLLCGKIDFWGCDMRFLLCIACAKRVEKYMGGINIRNNSDNERMALKDIAEKKPLVLFCL